MLQLSVDSGKVGIFLEKKNWEDNSLFLCINELIMKFVRSYLRSSQILISLTVYLTSLCTYERTNFSNKTFLIKNKI